ENLQIDYRWSEGNEDDTRKFAAELVALAPDVIFTSGSAGIGPLRRATRTVPIVFVLVPDPVGAGFVDKLAPPGGNITGFTEFDYGIGAKWLEVLKEIAPNTTRAAIIRDPAITAGIGQWGAILSVSPSVAIEVRPVNLIDANEIDRGLTAFARNPDGGLVWTGSPARVRARLSHHSAGARPRPAGVFLCPLFRPRRWSDLLRFQQCRTVPVGGRLR